MDLIPSSPLSHEVWLFDESDVNLACVGSILSSYLILTLASCLHGNGIGKGWNKFSIKTKTKSGNGRNSNSKLEEEQIRRVSQIIFHPDSENDLAILVLSQNLNSSIKIVPVFNANESTATNFSGRLCQEDSALSLLKMSEPSQCPFSSAFLCLLPHGFNEKISGCSQPFPGSSLICSDEERGEFLCGLLVFAPENVRKRGQIYSNITSHLEWIESASEEAKAKIKGNVNVKESSKLAQKESTDARFESLADDDYKLAVNLPDFEDPARKARSVDYDVVPHIAHGVTVNKSDPIPYQLSVRYYANPLGGNWEHICGAVILDEKTAITAAHCFYKTEDVHHYRVVAGENSLDTPDAEEQVLELEEILIHPEYASSRGGNDIAILHVNRFRFNKFVGGVWLSRFSNQRLSNKSAVISGWGKVSENSGLSNFLQKGNVSILPPEDCQNRLKNRMKLQLQEDVLCALDPITRTCSGDSGGPLVIQNYPLGNSTGNLLVGITSFGAENCSHVNRVGVFTEISSFYNWIQENRVTPFGCGGLINFDLEHDIIYQVPPEKYQRQRQGDSICLWIVSTGRKDAGASIEATILNNPSAQFNPKSDLILANYNFTINNSWVYTMSRIGVQYTVGGPFMTVYYRTSSSAPNAGFHLKLRDSITQSNITERLDVKLIEIPNADFYEGETQEFSYPSSISGASKYPSNERIFFVLQPQESGTKIKVNLTFVDTEENEDWLEIRTYRFHPTNLIRFSGRSNWTENILEGLKDEPIFFYFQSNELRGGRGFTIQYSEISAPKSSSCGGFIRFEREHEIVYKVPKSRGRKPSVCVWVVAAIGGTKIETKLLSNPTAKFQPQDSTLFALYDFNGVHGPRHAKIEKTHVYYSVNQPFILLYFRTNSSAPNSGFHIRLKEAGERKERQTVKYLELGSTDDAASATQKFEYPEPPASAYANDERTFIILKPEARHGKLKLDLKSLSTEESYDWVEIFSVRSQQPTTEFRFSGQGVWSNKSFVAEEDEPFIIYFHSDGSSTRSGFQFSYSEERNPGAKRGLVPSTGKMAVDQSETPVPYQLSLRMDGRHFCGAIILDKKTALSAAHCFTSQNMRLYKVVAGEQNLKENDSTEQVLQIERVSKHPDYESPVSGNDIAVIWVKGEFNFNDRVNNVWISSRNPPNFQDVTGVATGWSMMKTDGDISPVLKSMELEFMEHSKCKKSWDFLQESMTCGYNRFSNVCGGESGGPLVIKHHEHAEKTEKDLLVGISSFFPNKCEARDQPNGFTNVSHFYEWIAKSRSNSLCSSTEFQCFNGECIEEELKCDQIHNCADGSDEKMCHSHRRAKVLYFENSYVRRKPYKQG